MERRRGEGKRGAGYEFLKFVLPRYIHRLSIFVDQPTDVQALRWSVASTFVDFKTGEYVRRNIKKTEEYILFFLYSACSSSC
jgi:hypothetical protein